MSGPVCNNVFMAKNIKIKVPENGLSNAMDKVLVIVLFSSIDLYKVWKSTILLSEKIWITSR